MFARCSNRVQASSFANERASQPQACDHSQAFDLVIGRLKVKGSLKCIIWNVQLPTRPYGGRLARHAMSGQARIGAILSADCLRIVCGIALSIDHHFIQNSPLRTLRPSHGSLSLTCKVYPISEVNRRRGFRTTTSLGQPISPAL